MNVADELRKRGVSAKRAAELAATATTKGKPVEAPKGKPMLPLRKPDLKDAFLSLWKKFGPPIEPETELQFAKPRRWRFDVAFPEYRVAVELDGGQWVPSRHRSGVGFGKDAVKLNEAVMRGWSVLRFVTNDLQLDPMGTVLKVARLLEQGENSP